MIVKNLHSFVSNLRGVIHVGANIGEEAEWYERQGCSRVLWFEPNKELFPILERNIEGYLHHDAFNFGIHDILKSGVLHIANNKGQSSSLLEFGTHAVNHPDVKYIKDQSIILRRLDWFFKATYKDIDDYNFLNIDVQGVELNVIKSFGKLINKMDYIYTEVNDEEVYKDCTLIDDIDKYLSDYGFVREVTEMTRAHWGDALYKRN